MSLNLDKSTWKRVAFGDVIESITDRVDDPSAAGVDRYVGLEHLDPGVLTVQRWDTPDKVAAQKLRFQPGDVIFGRRRAYQKKVSRADFEGICSAHALVLRAKPDVIDPDFLPVFLASDYFLDRAISISVGSLSPTVNWRELKVQEFALPPLDDQKRIADVLWSAERHAAALRSRNHAVGKTMEQMLVAESMSPGSASEWEVVPFPEVIDFREGPGIMARDFREEGIPLIRLAGLVPNARLLDGCNYLDPQTVAKKWNHFKVEKGDVLLSTSATLGRVAIVDVGSVGAVPYTGIIRMRPADDRLDPKYIPWVLRSADFMRQVKDAGVGSVMAHFGPSHLRKMMVRVPSRGEQERLVAQFKQIEDVDEILRREQADLATLRSKLSASIFGDAS